MAKPRKKEPPGLTGGLEQEKEPRFVGLGSPQQSGDVYPGSWTIPPDDHDGLRIHIGSKGHIVLTQDRPFEDKAEIVLHPDEARELLEILPAAIRMAEQQREGG